MGGGTCCVLLYEQRKVVSGTTLCLTLTLWSLIFYSFVHDLIYHILLKNTVTCCNDIMRFYKMKLSRATFFTILRKIRLRDNIFENLVYSGFCLS